MNCEQGEVCKEKRLCLQPGGFSFSFCCMFSGFHWICSSSSLPVLLISSLFYIPTVRPSRLPCRGTFSHSLQPPACFDAGFSLFKFSFCFSSLWVLPHRLFAQSPLLLLANDVQMISVVSLINIFWINSDVIWPQKCHRQTHLNTRWRNRSNDTLNSTQLNDLFIKHN